MRDAWASCINTTGRICMALKFNCHPAPSRTVVFPVMSRCWRSWRRPGTRAPACCSTWVQGRPATSLPRTSCCARARRRPCAACAARGAAAAAAAPRPAPRRPLWRGRDRGLPLRLLRWRRLRMRRPSLGSWRWGKAPFGERRLREEGIRWEAAGLARRRGRARGQGLAGEASRGGIGRSLGKRAGVRRCSSEQRGARPLLCEVQCAGLGLRRRELSV